MTVKIKLVNPTKSMVVLRVFRTMGESTILPGESQEFDPMSLNKGWEEIVKSMGLEVVVKDESRATPKKKVDEPVETKESEVTETQSESEVVFTEVKVDTQEEPAPEVAEDNPAPTSYKKKRK